MNSFLGPNVGLPFKSIGLLLGPILVSFRSENRRIRSVVASSIVPYAELSSSPLPQAHNDHIFADYPTPSPDPGTILP